MAARLSLASARRRLLDEHGRGRRRLIVENNKDAGHPVTHRTLSSSDSQHFCAGADSALLSALPLFPS